jgi:hypothetical protein
MNPFYKENHPFETLIYNLEHWDAKKNMYRQYQVHDSRVCIIDLLISQIYFGLYFCSLIN